MKTILFLLASLFSFTGFAQQKFIPDIKQGAKLSYVLKDGSSVSNINIKLDSVSGDYIRMGWSMENVGNGGWILKKKSLESAKGGYWSNLEPNMQVELAENQSVVVLSKAQWKAIQTNKKLAFDGQNFMVQPAGKQHPYKLAGKDVDCIFLQSENGNTRIWVLKSPAMPVILKIEGNPVGVDAELVSVEL